MPVEFSGEIRVWVRFLLQDVIDGLFAALDDSLFLGGGAPIEHEAGYRRASLMKESIALKKQAKKIKLTTTTWLLFQELESCPA